MNKIFKSIKLGIGFKTPDDFRKEIKRVNCRISEWGSDILDKNSFIVSKEVVEVCLVKVSVSGLGFIDRATCSQIYERALQLGLALCPPEVGPQLRLQYLDQPEGEWLLIAMDPIVDSCGDSDIFRVVNVYGNLLLNVGPGYSGHRFGLDYHWIFIKPCVAQ